MVTRTAEHASFDIARPKVSLNSFDYSNLFTGSQARLTGAGWSTVAIIIMTPDVLVASGTTGSITPRLNKRASFSLSLCFDFPYLPLLSQLPQ